MMVALYTIASSRSWMVASSAVAGVMAAAGVAVIIGEHDPEPSALIGLALLSAIAVCTGIYVQGKRMGMSALWERAERLDRERELMAATAVAQERMRIAQELHDVIGHNVSLIVVQAQALGSTTADSAVEAATDAIADLGRATMVEMQRTLRLLRDDGGEATPWAPQPGLDSLDVLVQRSRAAGLDVEVAVRGTPRLLDQSIDTSAFRIIQESLTNVMKHAGGATTHVTLAYGTDVLDLSIVDDGRDDARKRAVPNASGGHGLIGMRERATLFGGTFTAGLRAGRGFEVRVSLPYQERTA